MSPHPQGAVAQVNYNQQRILHQQDQDMQLQQQHLQQHLHHHQQQQLQEQTIGSRGQELHAFSSAITQALDIDE